MIHLIHRASGVIAAVFMLSGCLVKDLKEMHERTNEMAERMANLEAQTQETKETLADSRDELREGDSSASVSYTHLTLPTSG